MVRQLFWTAGMLAAAICAHAADDSKKPEAGSGIAAAKKEIEALKRDALNPLPQPALQLGGAASAPVVPESILAMPGQPSPIQIERSKTIPNSRNPNWLVDGVAREAARVAGTDVGADARTSGLATTAGLDAKGGFARDGNRSSGEVEGGTDSNQTSSKQPRLSAPIAVNPLSDFMAGWMTPTDTAIFGTSGSPAVPAGTAGPAFIGSSSAEGQTSAAAAMGKGLGTVSVAGSWSPPPATRGAAENPFLIAQPAPVTLSAPIPAPAVPTAAAPRMAAPLPSPDSPSKPAIPGTQQKKEDEKYFPQLKRF